MHVTFCAQWGVDVAELESTPESSACAAYGAYILDVGMMGALRDLRSVNYKFMRVKEMPQAF
jgi:thiaminase (transcriptional activator TenA)